MSANSKYVAILYVTPRRVHPEHGGSRILRQPGAYLPSYMASHGSHVYYMVTVTQRRGILGMIYGLDTRKLCLQHFSVALF